MMPESATAKGGGGGWPTWFLIFVIGDSSSWYWRALRSGISNFLRYLAGIISLYSFIRLAIPVMTSEHASNVKIFRIVHECLSVIVSNDSIHEDAMQHVTFNDVLSDLRNHRTVELPRGVADALVSVNTLALKGFDLRHISEDVRPD